MDKYTYILFYYYLQMSHKNKRQKQLLHNATRARVSTPLDSEVPELVSDTSDDEGDSSGDDEGDSSDDENFVPVTKKIGRQQTITSLFEKYSSKLAKQITRNNLGQQVQKCVPVREKKLLFCCTKSLF